MHQQAKDFLLFVKTILPAFFYGKTVHDVGSGDINGNNKCMFEFCQYTGNDVCEAPNVSLVSKTSELKFVSSYFDTVISSECFEHDPEFDASIRNIYRMLKPGGLFTFTCASTGRREHGTRRTSPADSWGTRANLDDFQDHYKNITLEDLNVALNIQEHFSQWDAYYNSYTKDLYFWGIKKGGTFVLKPVSRFEYPYVTSLSSPSVP
jgi:SAM-dependent methyltransferase